MLSVADGGCCCSVVLRRLCAEYGLEPVLVSNFHQFFYERADRKTHMSNNSLLNQLKVGPDKALCC